ncbi:MAG: hypothetical protein JXB29_06065 [Sedimentisphaerales bacterium]|nr:hypothetical protein [Sedimentisphaerales bacterium]
MWNIFEQPWGLLLLSFISFLVVLILQSMWPEVFRGWFWLISACLAIAAFGLDIFVKTDNEQIVGIIKAGMEAVERQDSDFIETIISDEYEDSYHNSKDYLMLYCRALLSKPLVEKNRKLNLSVEISPPQATATLAALTRFDEKSDIFAYKQFMLTKTKFNFYKYGDNWLIRRAEVLEIDRHPVSWEDVK